MNDNPESELDPLDEIPTPTKNSRRWMWLILGVALVLVLGAAAFLGGHYLQNGPPSTVGGHDPMGRGLILAPELPTAAANVTGVFVRRQDNSIFVGTGNITGSKKAGTNGALQVAFSYDGPVMEVVVTTNTKIYKDVTFQNRPPNSASGDTTIQQQVVPGKLDEFRQNSIINVWGRKTGDRLIADVLLYNNPPG